MAVECPKKFKTTKILKFMLTMLTSWSVEIIVFGQNIIFRTVTNSTVNSDGRANNFG